MRLVINTMNKEHHEDQNKRDKRNLCLIERRNAPCPADAHVVESTTKEEGVFLFIQFKRGPKMASNDIMLSKCTSNSPTAVKRKWPVVFQVKLRNSDDDGILS